MRATAARNARRASRSTSRSAIRDGCRIPCAASAGWRCGWSACGEPPDCRCGSPARCFCLTAVALAARWSRRRRCSGCRAHGSPIYWIFALLAIRDLDFEAALVIRALRGAAISTAPGACWPASSGRDTAALDEAEVLRATIETVAENLSDAVMAPLFYLALGGPVGDGGLQGDQHAGQHGRLPQRAVPRIRLGVGARSTISPISFPPA